MSSTGQTADPQREPRGPGISTSMLVRLVIAVALPLVAAPSAAAAEPRTLPETRSPAAVPSAVSAPAALPPGAGLPTGADCAQRVRRNAWEPSPQNYPENATRGTRLVLPADAWHGFPSWRALSGRVDGMFTGTTDEILQWASCKWGFDDDLTRAQAEVESRWDQETVGDQGSSVGIMQVKAAAEGTPHRYTWPHSRLSTAHNVDYALGWRRACYEGFFAEGGWLPGGSRGDLWGCVGLWYSGRWQQGDAEYVAAVRMALSARPWVARGWPGP